MTLRKYITNFMLISAVAFSAVAVAPLRAAQAAPTDGVSTGIALDAGPVTASVRASSTLAWLDRYSTTLDPRAFTAFSAGRDALAADIATQLMIDPARMQAAWAGADIDHQVALMTGLSQLGVPYRRNTSKPGVSFDCSGLTTYAWSEAGYALARNSRAQINASAKRTHETAQAGDLVYYPGHIMMWLGVDGAILHSPFTGRNVEVSYIRGGRLKSVRFGDPTG